MKRWTFGLVAGVAALLGSSATVAAGGAAVAGASLAPVPLLPVVSHTAFVKPPTTADCEKQIGIACYSPAQFQRAYNLHPLYRKGLTGKGQTIVIVDSYGYANIRHELRVFDRAFHLPAPPSFRIIHPAGPIPPFNPTKRPQMVGWAQETSLDVQYSHAMAPGANILLVETPVAETLGVQGFPQIVRAENFVINHHLGNVISQSFGAPEAGFPDAHSILALRSAYKNAARHGVSVLAGSGDAGASGAKTLDPSGFALTFFLHRTPSWPPTDPLVTAVGGTQLHLDAQGNRTAPDNVWNDTALFNSPAAGGGGLSTVFPRPAYQNSVAGVVGGRRGMPDVSMSAAVDGGAIIFLDRGAAQGAAGFYPTGGTSESSPEFAGIVAIADQWAGHGLGLLNPALYRMEAAGKPGIVDVTTGNNTVTFPQGGSTHTVQGFNAGSGYDLASGVGTINGAKFVPELVRASHHH
ncbi:MAG TPA: S53 family peptidase [Gaiellales bacterium]|jgi:subtilase family serine protease|nr:S53 family peptidase [Gaiellales bacterium]